ncbi:TIGR03087 family PEP-CTERM/XrtA system glycosyltransferase [Rheinheimera sp. MMS21-TC3]|uniref:TIGR03087 family PEP-CTERM/XrtA system glycosyltransferase n=1 Tax=Rheinheimera sp. MMS21-TC3 TaxID=3072790 RepID=UPI0028C4E3DB|nr:TIGR03087 family PEP-CTERM/XrtA system glycosyltransferase [Rheinheimera sp. MMS21-TC3]WNO60695.1 TIGR03087 family PEP-CTERM/XrtA system glycosyltransferase [Rheinheimera sp. MMS21-TC3]
MTKPPLLMLVHRIPYPPNKGDKIRSFNLMKQLSLDYEIHLGCFVDDEFDLQYITKLNQWCKSTRVISQNKWLAKLIGLTGFISNKPITLPYYFSLGMQAWVKKMLHQHKIKDVLVYSSSMAQYVEQDQFTDLNRIIDFVDIDSDKWQQYASKNTGIKRWFYQREARLLQQYEQHICQSFTKSLFVSNDEAEAFRQLMPKSLVDKIQSLLNGVDTDFFKPDSELTATETKLPKQFIVFTGAMDYWANIDAVIWFSQQVWPSLKAKYSELEFVIVGGKPSAEVRNLTLVDGIKVTGRVVDVRPYIQHSLFAVAPMLIARGIQNKVLEAMAMNKAVICTSMAMEGINAPKETGAIVVDGKQEFIAACLNQLKQPQPQLSRQWILDHFTWPNTLKQLLNLFATRPSA